MNLLRIIALSSIAAAALQAADMPKTASGPKPNIIILYADDLGYGDLQCYNKKSKIPTPHLDRLASEGLRFTDAHSSSGICTPSRYAMLTGRHHWRDFHGIDSGFDKSFFKPGQLTLQEMLRQKGYTTACIGKWHLGWDWNSIRKPGTGRNSKEHDSFDWSKPFRGGPLDHGFDHYFGDNVINFPPYAWIENDRVLTAPDITFKTTPKNTKEGNWECREGPGRSDWDFYQVLPTLTKRGVEYIRSRKGTEKPFFLYFPLPSPHAPIVPTDDFDGKSKAGAYGDFVVQTDDACGQILSALRESGLDANTIVIFSADNGPEIYAYPRDSKFDHWSSAPLRGLKRDIYEGGHRVPTIIRWPGLTKAAAVTDALFSQVDLMATLAGSLGYDLPRDCAEDSHDFHPWLKGETKVSPRTTMVHNTFKDQYAIRHGEWVLIDAKSGTGRQPPPEWKRKHKTPAYGKQQVGLYHLKNDIGQRDNLAEKHPDKVIELKALLTKIRKQEYSAPRLSKLVATSQQSKENDSSCSLVPTDLRCDHQTGLPIVGGLPHLSWRVESNDRNQAQTAWQVRVSSSEELLAKGNGDLWDSGKVATARSPFAIYAGKPLRVAQRCHWQVRCWDKKDRSSTWSKAAVWEVAPSVPGDWQGAKWIDDGRPNPTRDEDFYQPDPAPLLRREFTLAKPILRARLHVAGLGYCLVSLNGKRLDDQSLDPPWTAFDKRILFRSHDVTANLTEGINCLGLTLGNGWLNPLPLRMWGQRNIREALKTGRPRAIACLVVEHPDGTSTTLTTGPEWTTTTGPTLRNSIYLGEERDARLSVPGWDQAGFNSDQWKPVRVTDDPLEPLQALSMPPVRATDPIAAVAVTTPKPKTHIIDFGRNFTGVPEIDLNVPAGTRITLRFGELLHPDGTLNPLTSVCGQIKKNRKLPDGSEISVGGSGAPSIAWQQDVYIARGGSIEHYRPDFTYHGFRFMEVTGLPEAPLASTCRGIPLHTELPSAGTFTCSNERLNRIQEMCLQTFLSNVVSVQSDCPHRERFGYGGDIVATSEAFLMNFDMEGFYTKTVLDWADAARPDGRFTDTAPFVGIDYCGVGWSMVHPLLLEQLHQYYGSRSLLEEQVPAAILWLDGEATRRKQGLVTKGLSDHEALEKCGGPALTTPMFIESARRVARLARVIGRLEDAARFEAMASESSTAWANRFLDSKTGKVGNGTQSEQTFALGFGAAPPDKRPLVFHHLLEQLGTGENPKLSTGIFGTRILMDELSRNGRGDLAYKLADRNTFPSWGWMLENDATTLWEHWAGGDNTYSHNHPMFGSISAWFFRWVGGIQPADDAIGFDRILIHPQPVQGLEWVKCSHRTMRGPIESNWSLTAKGVDYEIAIPPDSTAIIELPGLAESNLSEGGKPIAEAAGIQVLPSAGNLHRLQAGSGRYLFSVRSPGSAKSGR